MEVYPAGIELMRVNLAKMTALVREFSEASDDKTDSNEIQNEAPLMAMNDIDTNIDVHSMTEECENVTELSVD